VIREKEAKRRSKISPQEKGARNQILSCYSYVFTIRKERGKGRTKRTEFFPRKGNCKYSKSPSSFWEKNFTFKTEGENERRFVH